MIVNKPSLYVRPTTSSCSLFSKQGSSACSSRGATVVVDAQCDKLATVWSVEVSSQRAWDGRRALAKFFKVWDKIPEGIIPTFGDTQIPIQTVQHTAISARHIQRTRSYT